MARQKPAHHRGSHQADAARIVEAAKADPSTRCWKCKRTIVEVRRSEPNARWIGGHVVAGQVGGPYKAECSVCSNREGADITNAKRRGKRRRARGPLGW